MPYLLDTNALSEILKKEPNEGVVRWFGSTDEETLFISVFSIGEIQKGISKLRPSRRKNELQSWFDQTIIRFSDRLIPFGLKSSRIWGGIVADLELHGRVLPIFDSLIAATALEHSLTVVTRNIEDFEPAGVDLLNIWE